MPSRQIIVHLNTRVQERLNEIEDFNLYVDEVLSNYFGITFEEAYPEGGRGTKKWIGICHEQV